MVIAFLVVSQNCLHHCVLGGSRSPGALDVGVRQLWRRWLLLTDHQCGKACPELTARVQGSVVAWIKGPNGSWQILPVGVESSDVGD